MSNIAVMNFLCNFCRGKLVVDQELYDPFDFMRDEKALNGAPFISVESSIQLFALT